MFADAALHPAFAPDEIERVRSSRITTLLQQKDSPQALVGQIYSRVLFGNGPYGFTPLGTEEATKAAKREDFLGLWKKTAVPSNSALVIAGDLTEDQARGLAQKYFGGWTGEAFSAPVPPAPAPPSPAVYVSDKPGSPQTMLFVVGVGAARTTPDFAPLTVMNTIFGGLFSSRLNMNLREQHEATPTARARDLTIAAASARFGLPRRGARLTPEQLRRKSSAS